MSRWRRAFLISLVTTTVAFAANGAISAATPENAWHAAWTFPVVLLAAFVIAWAAETAQFLMSQGMALAILALLQTLPEFSVEAVLSWQAAHDPKLIPLVCANVTGSLRLLVGVGMPMVFFVQVLFKKKEEAHLRWADIRLEPQQAVEVFFLLPPLLYFFWIWWKGTLTMIDGTILLGIYVLYLVVLHRLPPEKEDEDEELGFVPRKILSHGTKGRWIGVFLLFVVGGGMLYVSVEPFVLSMKALAVILTVPTAIFIQWVSPFLSEFPEKVSAFYWARTVKRAPMGLMNIVSSNVNQWTLLVAMIPVVYTLGKGWVFLPLVFDQTQRSEILLTIVQSLLSFFLLANMKFSWYEAIGLFGLFVAQFAVPGIREEITYVYIGWILVEILLVLVGRQTLPALDVFAGIYRKFVRGEPITFAH